MMNTATNDNIEKFYTVDELAQMLDLHPETVRKFIRQKRLPAVKIGIAWKCPHSLLMKWMSDNANFNKSQ